MGAACAGKSAGKSAEPMVLFFPDPNMPCRSFLDGKPCKYGKSCRYSGVK